MTKYRLKNRELQRKLDELSDGAFSKDLHPYDDEHFSAGWGKTIFIAGYSVDENLNEKDEEQELKRFPFPQFGCFFNNDEVEEVPEYDPHNWNDFPSVTPPVLEIMRVRRKTSTGGFERFCASFRNGVWRDANDFDHVIHNVVCFRPWED